MKKHLQVKETCGVYQAKTRFSELVEMVAKGNRILITRHGQPVAELVPPRKQSPADAFGVAKDKDFYMAEDFDAPLEDFEAYME